MTLDLDKVDFPGGYSLDEQVVAIMLAAIHQTPEVNYGELEQTVMMKWVGNLEARHPNIKRVELRQDAYHIGLSDLIECRRSLLAPHLAASWFSIAYNCWHVLAIMAGFPTADRNALDRHLARVRDALLELGVAATEAECSAELENFAAVGNSQREIDAAAHSFLERVRYLHRAALRNRRVITPGFVDVGVAICAGSDDEATADLAASFLRMHGVYVSDGPAEPEPSDRLLVLISPRVIESASFWRNVAAWRDRGLEPMTMVADMTRQAFYALLDVESAHRQELEWLVENVAVELQPGPDRFVPVLRALEFIRSGQWWWHRDDAMSLGLARGLIKLKNQPGTVMRGNGRLTDTRYPVPLDTEVVVAGVMASAAFRATDEQIGPDEAYKRTASDLIKLRLKSNGRPYDIAWFALAYQTWSHLAAADLPGFGRRESELAQGFRQLIEALFALGIGTNRSHLEQFLNDYRQLPWPDTDSVERTDLQTLAFVALVRMLNDAAVSTRQRSWLAHPRRACFVSYARPDEEIARRLVKALEAKGAEVWWDENSITLGAPLTEALQAGIAGSRCLLLIATDSSAQSNYVRLEVQQALSNGLSIIPMLPTGEHLPEGWQSILSQNQATLEPAIHFLGASPKRAHAETLERLGYTDKQQVHNLLNSQTYAKLRKRLLQVRKTPMNGTTPHVT